MANPKKSKAFIITFILVLILLLVAYWLFSKKDSLFKTDGISFGRIFEPLVVSPEQTKLDVIRDRIFLENNPSNFDPNNNPNNFPVVTITSDPISVQKGGSSTISWTSTNATSCKTSDGTLVGTSGSISTGALNNNTSFSISCTGNNGATSANTKIKTGNTFGDVFKFPIVSVGAYPATIKKGESSTISWNSNNTNSCFTEEGKGTGTSGSFSTGVLNATRVYSITCTGKYGVSGANAFVTVLEDSGPDTYEPGPCTNGADNPLLCTTLNGQCLNGATNQDLCTISADGKCLNGAINPDSCDEFENAFCAANKITKILYMGNKDNDKAQVTSLQLILSKLRSSLGTTYLKEADVDGDFGLKTRNAVALFQKDKELTQRNGTIDGPTMVALNTECNDFFNNDNDSLAQCADGIDNDGKEGTDNEDPSCHSDFNANNASSYDKKIADESRTKTNTECGDGINNDNQEGPDYQDKDCYVNGVINYPDSYDKYITSEKGGLPTPGDKCPDGAINWPTCNLYEDSFCIKNKITKVLVPGLATNDKTQVTSLQTLLSKFPSSSLKKTYLKTADINGLFPTSKSSGSTQFAVATFQKDNNLNANKRMGTVDQETITALNNKCDELFGKPKICPNPKAVNYPDCNKDKDNKCLNGLTTANCLEVLEKNYCAVLYEHPLQFTDAEKAKLDELLRKFYLIAPTLKTEDDLALVYNELNRYKTFIEQLDSLTGQCYLQTNSQNLYASFCINNPETCKNEKGTLNSSYITPTRYGNPWFKYKDRTGYYSSVYPELFKFNEPSRRAQLLLEEGTESGRSILIYEKDFEQMLNIW